MHDRMLTRRQVLVDELLELADRIVVIFEGRLVYETARDTADLPTIGHYMASREPYP